jgi:hypothetical protein
MRALSLISLLLACGGCTVRVPYHPALEVTVKARVRADVKVQAGGRVDAEVKVPAAVALEGAEVVEFFGVPLDGVEEVVFVLDRSGSMSGPAQGRIALLGPAAAPAAGAAAGAHAGAPPARRKIDVAHDELVDALARLPAGTRVNVLFFNDELEAFAPDIVPLADGDRDGLVAFVRGTRPSGRTALAPAMRTAFLMNARRIVLLSDGLGNVGGDARAVLRDAREAMLGGVRIDAIGLGGDQDAALLGSLAAESGGLYQPL